MACLALNSREREALAGLLTPLALTNEVRRAQALLWLDAGHSPQVVAARLHVSRQTVYNWLAGFHRRCGELDIQARLADRKRSGRPRTLPTVIDPLIAAVVEHAPPEFGYPAPTWNAKLLAQHLREAHHIAVNRASVSLALGRLGVRWKPGGTTQTDAHPLVT